MTPPSTDAAAEAQQPRPLAGQLAAVADRAGQRPGHQAQGVGHVRGDRRDPDREKGRERDQRSRPHHGVDGAGGDPREEDRHHLQEGHCAGGSPGSPSAAVDAGVTRRGRAGCSTPRRRRSRPRTSSWVASSVGRPRAGPARSAPMSTRVTGPSTLSGMPWRLFIVEPETLERLADLARHDPHLVGVALGDLRHHLEVLVGQQRLVRAAVVDRLEHRLDGLALTLRPEDRGTPGRPGRAGSATRGHPRRSGSRPACHPRR